MPIVVQQPGCEKVTQSRSYIWMPDEGVILSLLELSSFSLFSTSWESQCIAVCSTRLLSTWSTAVHQSQTFPADVIYGQPLDITWPNHVPGSAVSSPDCTALPAQHFRSSGLLCCRSDGLELATGQSPWPSTQQQQLQTITADEESVSLLPVPLSTHSTVEMLHDSALYKSIIDIDIDIDIFT